MTKAQCWKILAYLEACYREELPEQTKNAWAHMLSDLDVQAATAAAEAHVASSHRFPAISDIRRLAARHEIGSPSPDLAWSQAVALAAARPLDGIEWGPPPEVHQLVAKAARLVGLDVIGNTDTEDPWTRKDFLRIYDELVSRSEHEIQTFPALTGGDETFRALAEGITNSFPSQTHPAQGGER